MSFIARRDFVFVMRSPESFHAVDLTFDIAFCQMLFQAWPPLTMKKLKGLDEAGIMTPMSRHRRMKFSISCSWLELCPHDPNSSDIPYYYALLLSHKVVMIGA